jgi:hypothetical protein
VIFEQQAQRGDLPEIIGGNRSNLEAALAFGDDQAFGAHAVQQFAQRADAGAVALADLFQPKLLAGRKNTENNIRANPAINQLPDRFSC